jgi:heme-degrading monooxygenase HmoA
MYIAMFILEPGERDEEFHKLNGLIQEAAHATEGFLGEEQWLEREGTRVNAIYYWRTLAALQSFSRHPSHLEAKRQYQRWYGGYHVVISEVVSSYGDDAFEHLTPNSRTQQRRQSA